MEWCRVACHFFSIIFYEFLSCWKFSVFVAMCLCFVCMFAVDEMNFFVRSRLHNNINKVEKCEEKMSCWKTVYLIRFVGMSLRLLNCLHLYFVFRSFVFLCIFFLSASLKTVTFCVDMKVSVWYALHTMPFHMYISYNTEAYCECCMSYVDLSWNTQRCVT